MHFEQSFSVNRPPPVVFDYMANPDNLQSWQTSKTFVEPLTEGPPRLGARFREGTRRPGGRVFEQIVEFTEFDRPHRLSVHVVDGPYPVDGTWSLQAGDGGATQVHFVAEGELRGVLRLLGPVARRVLDRQFLEFHRNLARNLDPR